MPEFPPIVYVVDDDSSLREALAGLIRSVGWRVDTFVTAADFLARRLSDSPSCVVLDVRLPGLSGLDLQDQLAEKGDTTPIMFITGHGDIPMTVRPHALSPSAARRPAVPPRPAAPESPSLEPQSPGTPPSRRPA